MEMSRTTTTATQTEWLYCRKWHDRVGRNAYTLTTVPFST